MNFLNNFESKIDGVNDTAEFVIRVSIITLSAVILVVVMALVVGLFLPNDIVDSTAILEMINPAFQTIIGAFVGLLGGLSLNANARDKEEPVEPEPLSWTMMRWLRGKCIATIFATTTTTTARLTRRTSLTGVIRRFNGGRSLHRRTDRPALAACSCVHFSGNHPRQDGCAPRRSGREDQDTI